MTSSVVATLTHVSMSKNSRKSNRSSSVATYFCLAVAI